MSDLTTIYVVVAAVFYLLAIGYTILWKTAWYIRAFGCMALGLLWPIFVGICVLEGFKKLAEKDGSPASS